MEVQIFGVKKNAATRKAQRFFAERRVRVHFVDLDQRAASPGELRRFAQKFGVDALVDRTSRRYGELGLAHADRPEAWWLDKLAQEPLLLHLPLVRSGNLLTVGEAEPTWREWVRP